MYIYESHMGGLYAHDEELSYEQRHCSQCGDTDWCIGSANDRTEAWELLESETDMFNRALCENCEHKYDYDYCDEECENAMRAGGYDYEYVQNFIKEYWD